MSAGDILAILGATMAVIAALGTLAVQTNRLIRVAEDYMQMQYQERARERAARSNTPDTAPPTRGAAVAPTLRPPDAGL